MTTIALLGGDWEYQFEDEFVTGGTNRQGTRMLRYVSGAVRTTNEVYSALAAAADDFQAMGFKNPMLPVTPNAYTMENKAFISRKSTEFLKEGTITANWALSASPDGGGNGVLRVPYTGGTNFAAGDIGREVVQAGTGDSGTLLDFEIEPDGTTVAWIRPSDSTPVTGDLFDGTGALTATGGTGSTTSSTAATSGTSQYTAIQAIGSVPTATEVYIVQNRVKLADADTNTFQFWATDTTASLGIISVLVRTTNAGTVISAGDLEVFARKYGALYDNFRLNVAAGGFSALPLASSPDINNTTGVYNFPTTSSTNTFNVGNLIYVGASFATATKKGVITAVTGTNPTVTVEYYLVGDLTQFANTDAVKEYDPIAQADGDATATAGTPVNNPGGPLDTGTGGGNITFTMGDFANDFDNTGSAEPYSLQVNCDAKATGIVYERMKYVTRRGSDNTFWATTTTVPGEQYRGIEAIAYYDTPTGTLVAGEDLNNETQTAQTMRLVRQNPDTADEGVNQAYLALMDLQPSTVTLANNDVLADTGSTDQVLVDTAGAGGAVLTVVSPKSSPFGTYTGTQIFGAQGVHFTNLGAGDAQNYILTDDLGTLRSPPNTISFTVTNTRAGDRILVARDTGVAGVIDKDQFGGMTVTAASATSITVGGSIDSEVPAAGYIRVVENTLQQEHKYTYSSRTTGASGVFTLKAITPGTSTAGTSSTKLFDTTNASFITDGVEVGMLIQNTTGSSTYEVVSIDSASELTIRHLYGTDNFTTANAYTINETIQAYAVTDDLFDLILDIEEDVGTDGSPGSASNTLVKTPAANFGVVVQVRQGGLGGILPFELNQTQGDGNTSVTAVRTPDTIAT